MLFWADYICLLAAYIIFLSAKKHQYPSVCYNIIYRNIHISVLRTYVLVNSAFVYFNFTTHVHLPRSFSNICHRMSFLQRTFLFCGFSMWVLNSRIFLLKIFPHAIHTNIYKSRLLCIRRLVSCMYIVIVILFKSICP